jgi:hypothetical protein
MNVQCLCRRERKCLRKEQSYRSYSKYDHYNQLFVWDSGSWCLYGIFYLYLLSCARIPHVASHAMWRDHFGWMEEGEFEVSAFQLSCLKLKRGQTFPAFF